MAVKVACHCPLVIDSTVMHSNINTNSSVQHLEIRNSAEFTLTGPWVLIEV